MSNDEKMQQFSIWRRGIMEGAETTRRDALRQWRRGDGEAADVSRNAEQLTP